jgi:acyl carrier protein
MLDHSDSGVRDRILNIVRQILARRSTNQAVWIDDDLHQIGLTSLEMVNLMLTIEAAFDVQIPEGHMTPSNFRSVSKICAIITTLKGDK